MLTWCWIPAILRAGIKQQVSAAMKLSHKSCPLLSLFVAVMTSAVLFTHALAQQEPVTSTRLLQENTSWDGVPIAYPQGTPEITALVVEIAPGAQTGWHSHPVPSFGLMLEGELEVELRNGQRKRLAQGDVIVETVNTWHNGTNVGTVPVRIAVIYTGVEELPLTETEAARPE